MGDIITELGGKKIENIYDYTYAIEALKIGQKVKVVVQRKGKRVNLELIPGSRAPVLESSEQDYRVRSPFDDSTGWISRAFC